jgi:hypothetical protein
MGIKFKAPKITKEDVEAFFNTTFIVVLLLTAGLSALNLRGIVPLNQDLKSVLGAILGAAAVLSIILIVHKAVKTTK